MNDERERPEELMRFISQVIEANGGSMDEGDVYAASDEFQGMCISAALVTLWREGRVQASFKDGEIHWSA